MKKMTLAGLVALSFAAVASEARAHGICLGGEICISGRAWARRCDCSPCGGGCPGGGCGLGGCGLGGGGYGIDGAYPSPWYMYYPYGAYFQDPAPTGYPYWPGNMTPYNQPNVAPAAYGVPGYPPAGYNQQIPSYWYGHQP